MIQACDVLRGERLEAARGDHTVRDFLARFLHIRLLRAAPMRVCPHQARALLLNA